MKDTTTIKPGYKKTAIGIIPEDWEMTKIQNIGKVSSGLTPNRSNPDYFVGGEIPWFRTTDLNNSFLFDSSEKVTEKALTENSLRSYPEGTIVVAMYGGFNQIGRTGLLGVSGTINQALSAISLNDKKAYSLFLLYWLNFYVGIWKRYAGSSRKDPNITGSDVKSFPFALVELTEQKAIADCLSTWDKAIEMQTQLIKAKKEFKKGLMQGIFNGQLTVENGQLVKAKEGENFTEEWEEVRLGDIANISTGKSNKEDAGKNFKYVFFDRSSDVLTSEKYIFDKEAIIVPGEGADFIPKYFKGKFDLHQRAYAIMDFKGAFGKFIFYRLLINRKHLHRQAVGSTVKSLRLPNFQEMPMKIPSMELQRALVQVLQLVDQEIELLEKKLAQLQIQKKGLMQVLLTGEKRLVK